MKLKRIGILVLAAAVLAVMTGGNALAYSWTSSNGVDCSILQSSGTATLNSGHVIDQTIDVWSGLTYTWGNLYYNLYPSTSYMGYSWSSGIATGTDWKSSWTLDYQVTYDNQPASAKINSIGYNNYPDKINIYEKYWPTSDNNLRATAYVTTQKMNGRV